MKYSVIIPVYKAEATLEKCLDSLLNQIHDDVELMLINDGSPDSSGEICEKYAAEHECIRYFCKQNGGVSSARNLALDKATGEYILFVDSDDYVSENYFAEINAAVDDKQPDMLLFGYRNFGGNSSAWNMGSYYADAEAVIAEHIGFAIREYLFSSLWSKVFRRSIIEEIHLRFNDKLAIGEDQTFIFSYSTRITSLMSIEAYLYNCNVENQDSLSRKPRKYLAEQLQQSNMEMICAAESSNYGSVAKKRVASALAWMYYRSAYSSCKELLKFDFSRKERRRKIRRICKLFGSAKVKPMGLKCWLIALPIKLRMAFAIDMLIRKKLQVRLKHGENQSSHCCG